MATINDQPSRVLEEEHKHILRVLVVFEKLLDCLVVGLAVERDALGKCVRFFRLFADQCHHAKEEDLLFPAMEERGILRDGGPIGAMMWEHRMARQLTGELVAHLSEVEAGRHEQLTQPGRRYIELLRGHIERENHCLFPMGDQVLNADDKQSVCAKFCEAASRRFEGASQEDLIELADELESYWEGVEASA